MPRGLAGGTLRGMCNQERMQVSSSFVVVDQKNNNTSSKHNHLRHGTCSGPGDCLCKPGWRGPLCDQVKTRSHWSMILRGPLCDQVNIRLSKEKASLVHDSDDFFFILVAFVGVVR